MAKQKHRANRRTSRNPDVRNVIDEVASGRVAGMKFLGISPLKSFC